MEQKRWLFKEYEEAAVQHLQGALGIHSVFCQLLVQRGIDSYEAARQFFRPKLGDLHDPFLMCDMQRAVERIEKAMADEEGILIYGDYDVDGTTSVALLFEFLLQLLKEKPATQRSHLEYYIPNRDKEGYGVSKQGLAYAQSRNCSLVITLDCGIKAVEETRWAKEQGMDVIICDHHLPSENLPPAYAILNPKRAECSYPFKDLSGCGIGFKLAQAMAQHRGMPFSTVEPLLDLLAVSIACDLVPIRGENRILAHYGLKRFNENPRIGIAALKKLARRKNSYSIGDIVFSIGPLINAAGRVSDAKESVRVLLSKTRKEAEQARSLYQKNKKRREIEQRITQEAIQMAKKDVTFEGRKAAIFHQKNWHKGVIGIVASRMVERFHRPALVLTENDGYLVGSARSVPGFDIYEILETCREYLVNFGGHQYAAGVTIASGDLKAFKQRFEQEVASRITKSQQRRELYIDAELDFKDLKPKFWNILQQFAPFGPENPQPVFLTKHVTDTGYSDLIKGRHIKLLVKQIDSEAIPGIAFHFGEYFEELNSKKPFHLCYVVEENEYAGRKNLQIQVKDMRLAE